MSLALALQASDRRQRLSQLKIIDLHAIVEVEVSSRLGKRQ
jgi:hypothetical protein